MRLAVFITRWVTLFSTWSDLGIERIDVQIQFGVIPFEGVHEIQIVKNVSRGKRPPRMDKPPLSDKTWNLIKRCWVKEAVRRPAMEDIIEKMMAWRHA